MYDYIVDWMSVRVVPLYYSCSCVPNFYCSILRTCDHPFCVHMKRNSCYIVIVALKHHYRARIGTLDIVESNDMATGCGEVFLVWGYAETVDLRLGMLDRS